jgi:predicted phosphodiesterase
MRILLCADFHSDFARLEKYSQLADLCICCGDIFDYHDEPASDFAFPIPFYSIIGNKEHWGGEKLKNKLGKVPNFFWLNSHLEKLEKITGIRFFGIEFSSIPQTLPDDTQIIISHEPAKGLADTYGDSFRLQIIENCGNRRIRRLVDKYKPLIVVSGHVHKFQETELKETTAISLAPALNPPVVILNGLEIEFLNK